MDYKTDLKMTKYYEYVSLGNKCPTAMMLQNLNLRKHSYPFDWIPTLPHHILTYIKNKFIDFFPQKDCVLNKENIWFGHHDFNNQETKITLERRIDRLYELFNTCDKKTLFIYTTEADIYNEMKSRDNENQNYLDILSFKDYLKTNYPKFLFDILIVNMNVTHINEENIYNVTINVDKKFLSDNMETHFSWCYDTYRGVLQRLLTEVLL